MYLLSAVEIIALRVIDIFSRYSSPLPVQTKNPQDVWDVFCGGWLGIFVLPKSTQTDEAGEWRSEIWPDLRAERRIKLQLQGAGAHSW